MTRFFLLVGLLGISVVSLAQSDLRPQVLVLGTYHMANPGHDIHNMQADDVLLPKRQQQEIAQLIDVLKDFDRPRLPLKPMSAAPGSRNSIPTTSRENTR